MNIKSFIPDKEIKTEKKITYLIIIIKSFC